jgi:hypothetical protein
MLIFYTMKTLSLDNFPLDLFITQTFATCASGNLPVAVNWVCSLARGTDECVQNLEFVKLAEGGGFERRETT